LNRQLRDLPESCRPRLAAGPLRFVPQAELPAGEGYEAFVYRTARVPTRELLHDLLNGLVWLHWPLLKARLNALHVQQPQSAGAASVRCSVRGPVRDALTLLDENAALLQAPAELGEALRRRDWPRLFQQLRPLWAQARLHLVGHALLEKLAQPRKAICAHVLILDAGLDLASSPAEAWLDPAWLAGKPFHPLPVLGVPGWWAGNADASFYADAAVFRPPGSHGGGRKPASIVACSGPREGSACST